MIRLVRFNSSQRRSWRRRWVYQDGPQAAQVVNAKPWLLFLSRRQARKLRRYIAKRYAAEIV